MFGETSTQFSMSMEKRTWLENMKVEITKAKSLSELLEMAEVVSQQVEEILSSHFGGQPATRQFEQKTIRLNANTIRQILSACRSPYCRVCKNGGFHSLQWKLTRKTTTGVINKTLNGDLSIEKLRHSIKKD